MLQALNNLNIRIVILITALIILIISYFGYTLYLKNSFSKEGISKTDKQPTEISFSWPKSGTKEFMIIEDLSMNMNEIKVNDKRVKINELEEYLRKNRISRPEKLVLIFNEEDSISNVYDISGKVAASGIVVEFYLAKIINKNTAAGYIIYLPLLDGNLNHPWHNALYHETQYLIININLLGDSVEYKNNTYTVDQLIKELKNMKDVQNTIVFLDVSKNVKYGLFYNVLSGIYQTGIDKVILQKQKIRPLN